MDPSTSRQPYLPVPDGDLYSVPHLLQKLIEWTSGNSFRVAGPELQALLNYVSTLKVDSDLAVRVYGKLGAVEGRCDGFDFSVESVDGVLQELGELFRVPKLHQLIDNDSNTLMPSQLVACFITFLVKLLDAHSSSSVSYHRVIQFQIRNLASELKFLVAILGDAPFEATENEQVQSILAEFEQVANEAGILLHSLIFSPYHTSMEQAIKAFLERQRHRDLLSSNIAKFLHSLPSTISFPERNDTRDSLFIVRNLIHDLMDRVTRTPRNYDTTWDDSSGEDIEKSWDLIEMVGDKDLQMLYVRLRLLLPFLMKRVNVPQHLEAEFNQLLLQIRDKGCEVEYLIKTDLPLWYRAIRLIHVTDSLVLIGSRLHGMKTIYDIGTLIVADDCSAQPSLQMEEDHGHDDAIVQWEDNEEKTNTILEQLVGEEKQRQIITIFGMAGIGKTTRAKELYHHELITCHFDRRAWSTVSQTYQKNNLLIEILNCLEGNSGKNKTMTIEDEESLLLKIYQSLKGRRYLIVMDDLWDSYIWEDLQRFFPDDQNGSRVLLTSRDKDVAPSGSINNKLPLLSVNQCWELLQNKVFHGEVCPQYLEDIGKEIAMKCGGLPLTAVVVAGVLSNIDRERQAWKNVGDSLKSHMLLDQGNSTMQILEFSYKHLSKHLKQCFLYFGVFAEDERIYTRDLKWLWIAEGFIPENDEETMAERLAEEYLIQLIDKSLVIVTKKRFDGGARVCVIHDLLRELCLRIAKRELFRKVVDDGTDVEWGVEISQKRVPGDGCVGFSYLVPYCKHFQAHQIYCVGKMEVSAMNQSNSWVKMISGHTIGVPIHDRFLMSSEMAQSIDLFENLEFLMLKWPHERGTSISSNSLKRAKLKYIHIENRLHLDSDWDTTQTTKLKYLSRLVIEKAMDIEILRCSPHLHTLKCAWYPDYWSENEVNWYIDLHFLTQLHSLSLSLSNGDLKPSPSSTEIKLPSSIKKLHLTSLRLRWEKISVIGALPNLESLKLDRDSFVGERWDTSDGQLFQQLKILKMRELDLVQWNVSSNQHFPKLQQLILEGCRKLEEIPCEVGEIDTLQLISITYCNEEVEECGRKIKQEQEEWGNQQLKLVIIEVKFAEEGLQMIHLLPR